MGLSNFPSPAEGVLPVLVMNTVVSVALLKNLLRSVLQVMGATWNYPNLQDEPSSDQECPPMSENRRGRRISITQFKSLCENRSNLARTISGYGCGGGGGGNSRSSVECCVCLCSFEPGEEVSELSCKHFFHKWCLEKWFDSQHSSCPLCRSIL